MTIALILGWTSQSQSIANAEVGNESAESRTTSTDPPQIHRDAAASSNVLADTEPRIDIWYGDRQRFGHNGVPQRWVNVLGRVTPSKDVGLTYALNGDAPQPLPIGPNFTRLAEPGDFNVELECSELREGTNTLVITASHGSHKAQTTTVEVVWHPVRSVTLPVEIDWQSADSIQDVAQVVDGLWRRTPQGVRVVEPYYDRVIAIGDKSWTDYQVTVPVTFHGLRRPGPKDGGRNVIHAAIAVRWPGHHDGDNQDRPRVKWYPLGATAEFMIQKHPAECRWRILGGGSKRVVENKSRTIQFDKRYMLKHRVNSPDQSKTIYSVKFWDAEQPEPKDWNVTAEEDNDVPTGGALILAHYSDVTFGNVIVESARVDIR